MIKQKYWELEFPIYQKVKKQSIREIFDASVNSGRNGYISPQPLVCRSKDSFKEVFNNKENNEQKTFEMG